MTYKEQRGTIEWDRKRKQILARDKRKCRICNGTKNLHVHHLYYIPKLKAWEYEDEGLVTVCDLHHELLTFELPKLSGIIAYEILIGKITIP